MRNCKKWETKVPYTSDGLFLVSVCNIVSIKVELIHFVVHLAVGTIFGFAGSLGLAFGIEIRDGEVNRIEGFNVSPDFVFRAAGAIVGGWILYPILYGWVGQTIEKCILGFF